MGYLEENHEKNQNTFQIKNDNEATHSNMWDVAKTVLKWKLITLVILEKLPKTSPKKLEEKKIKEMESEKKKITNQRRN